MVSTWFSYVRCVTSVRRIMSHVRERAGIATSWWKLLIHLPKAYGPKWWREREGSGDFSVDFSEVTLLPFLWLLLFLRNWQCLLGNRACILHPKISYRPVYHGSLGGKYIFVIAPGILEQQHTLLGFLTLPAGSSSVKTEHGSVQNISHRIFFFSSL